MEIQQRSNDQTSPTNDKAGVDGGGEGGGLVFCLNHLEHIRCDLDRLWARQLVNLRRGES